MPLDNCQPRIVFSKECLHFNVECLHFKVEWLNLESNDFKSTYLVCKLDFFYLALIRLVPH